MKSYEIVFIRTLSESNATKAVSLKWRITEKTCAIPIVAFFLFLLVAVFGWTGITFLLINFHIFPTACMTKI